MTGLVYLASYPRSGNTLLRMILWQCFGLKTVSEYDEASRIAAQPEWLSLVGSVEQWDTDFLVRLNDEQGIVPFKTHAHPQDTAYPDGPTIYVIRDGREVCVSYWRFYHDILGKPVSLRDVIRGDCMFGSWSDHVKAWLPESPLHRGPCVAYGNRGVSVFFYEDLKARLAMVIRRLSMNLDREALKHSLTPWNQLHQADPAFFRSGRNDTWRELMKGDDLALFDELHGETMREYGYCEEVCHAAT